MADDPFEFLRAWYHDHCDEDWEHQQGVRIGTLDNPGWSVRVDLAETCLDGRRLDRVTVDRSDQDWVHWWSDGLRFQVACGPRNLREALVKFAEFAVP
ncbi:immunity 53 family protein [Prauserella cavernicola]|uniref:Immunity 53 family protein n=1 Tax=Prauserella cavernicola TaxID=2800127 RepID=A0A934V840_9PSEU|nr:immunity 53 family protein [Prauserella cavernicola]MBK1787900.1 immunity 53 family protein [Prauserella cavernicola]